MKANKLIRSVNVVVFASALSLSTAALAGPGHEGGSHGHNNSDSAHMMSDEKMNKHMREVMGQGRINKVMADRSMVNIKHDPIPELNWPKMRMNFKTQEKVNLSALEPGQQVSFTLLVDNDNNYVIKEIIVK